MAPVRILVADDHETVTKGIMSILSARKDAHVFDEAKDGTEAIQRAREVKPDLIILDITMPVLDGFEAAKQIKSFLPAVPILFLTMHEGKQVLERAKAVGAQGFVRKDRSGVVLLKAVDALLHKQTFFEP